MRGSRRHPTWDYGEPGGYFVTICADRRWFRSVPVPERGVAGLFASVCGPQPDLTELGLVVQAQWLRLPDRFPHVTLDEFVIMPDHVHGILWVGSVPGTEKTAPGVGQLRAPAGTRGGSLPAVVQAFKAASAYHAGPIVSAPHWTAPVRRFWQRNYDEQLIRDRRHLAAVRRYIRNNPRKLLERFSHDSRP